MERSSKYSFPLLDTPSTSLASNRDGDSFGDSKNSSSESLASFTSKRHPGPTKYRRMDDISEESISSSDKRFSSTIEAGHQHTPLSSGSIPNTPRSCRSENSTPGSSRLSYSTSGASSDSPSVVVALVEGRGLARGEIGMACIDLRSPVLILSQFCDSQTYVKTLTKLQFYQPLEIIMPNTACESGNMTKLFKLISTQYQGINIATIQRKYFNEARGLQYIKQLCLPECNAIEMEIRSKYYCLATVAALLKYIEFIQNVIYAPTSLRVKFTGSEQTTMIDVSTATNLELLQNIRQPQSEHTLYGVLNSTKTPMGARLLRSNILQPPNNGETIKMRLDAVAELVENEDMFYSIQAVIKRFLDIDHLLSMLVQIPKQESIKTAESKITNVICLKHSLELVEPLADVLRGAENCLIKEFAKMLDDNRYEMIRGKVGNVIHEDTRFQKGALNMRTQKCFAIKQNVNGLLDVSRKTYSETVDDISELVTVYAEQHSLPLKTGCNTTRGFFIQLFCGGKSGHTPETLPGIFTKVTKNKNTLSFTTPELLKLNDRTKESLHEIYLMSNVVLNDLLQEIRGQFGCLYQLAECVAILDMLVSFAHNFTLSEYVRPDLTDTLAIKQGRHPILDKIAVDPPVPNDTYASDESNFMIITGPNMSGKSTFLRQIALLQIMAQIGSFVPAVYASFRIADHIFSRIGSDDDIETNCSTFMLEMKEVNYIIQNATSSSLVIIDELGRGTSTDEGIGICFAVCEHILDVKAFTFFATHFMELTNLGSMYPNVENYHFEVQRNYGDEGQCEKVTYTHVLAKGRTREKHYGIQLAEVSTLPREIVDDAKQLSERLAAQKKICREMSAETVRERAVFRLAKRLTQAATNSRLDSATLRDYLRSLKSQYQHETSSPGTGEE